jgi:hypothetical protein
VEGMADGGFLVGPRVRLRSLERTALPRYQDLLSEPEINLPYGGLSVPDNFARFERRYAPASSPRRTTTLIW